MKGSTAKSTLHNRFAAILMALLLGVAGPFIYMHVRAGNAPMRSISMSSTETSGVSTYKVSFTTFSGGPLGSVQIQFCSNDPFPGQPCTAPNGIDLLAGTLTDQSGVTGFIVDPSSTSNNILLSRAPAGSAAGTPVSFTFDGVVNGSDPGTQYVRLQTFATADGSGPPKDYGGMAYAIGVGKVGISAKVPPFLLFCSGITIFDNFCNTVVGNYVNFGNLSSSSTKSATSEFLVATNGESGYNVSVSGNTMTSGNNIIPAITSGDVSRPGVNQFGINLRANTTPAVGVDPIGPGLGQPAANYNTPNFFRFNSGDIIASGTQPEDTRKYTVSYLVNINSSLPVGYYVTTVTYTTFANF